jgi:hypothetical protein
MRNKLLGAEYITPLVESMADDYPDHKGAILADLLEDELDAMGELDMKAKLKEYMWEAYAKFDDEILDEMWQMLAHQWGLELKWTEKDTEENIRKMVEFVDEENK